MQVKELEQELSMPSDLVPEEPACLPGPTMTNRLEWVSHANVRGAVSGELKQSSSCLQFAYRDAKFLS